MSDMKLMDTEDEVRFCKDVHKILDDAKNKTYAAANNIMTYAYWNVGKRIIEQEQKGDSKARYGSYLVKRLSQELSEEYGIGFSVANIRNCRQLYLTFPKESYGYSLIGKIHWSHLRTIMRLDNEEVRYFYLNEVANEYWSVKELECNIKSGYFKRILSTQFPEKIGQTPKFVKDPYVLEFMGIKDDNAVIEKDVENAIISNLQKFLLEMGRGFCFVDRCIYVPKHEGVLKYFLHSLYDSYDEEVETKQIVGEILNLRIEEVLCWFHYVNRDEGKEIYYHTFHSTKGLEYENVIMVLGKDFGQDKGLFELFFKEYGEDISQDLPKYEQYERGRNILYVAVTRAIKNLRILYIDDLEEIRHNIEKIFGKAEAFPIQMT